MTRPVPNTIITSLTPAQFTEKFGPAESDYQAVIAFARANHLQVSATHPNRLLLDVSGSVAEVEQALHVTLRTYQHPTEHRLFYAPDGEPSLALGVPLLHISGLDNYALPRTHLQTHRMGSSQKAAPNSGAGPNGTYLGADFRKAYVPDTTLNGAGQVVGLFQLDGYTASDITYYENQAGLPNVPLQNVLIDGATGNPSYQGGEVEVSLDIEMVISMATNLAEVIVYEAPDPSPFVDVLNRMATDNLARQLSCSWFLANGPAEPAADLIFQEMAVQGQSFFNASGDSDAWTGLISFPGDTPYITQVGGTTLTTGGPGGPWVSETVWNWDVEYGSEFDGQGSSGGVSTQYPIPSWQTNISMVANQGSRTNRNTPDVAMTADNIYVRADGTDLSEAGTSCAAPLWAGFAALVNQQAATIGQPPIGFINPALGAIGASGNYPVVFHDITTGSNTWSGSPGKYRAVPGYDLCTGWGTPAGQGLINALANPEPLIIRPANGFTAIGGMGGPFSITSQYFSLTNLGTNALTWTLSNPSAWLAASPTNGTLTPGGPSASVLVSLNNAASNLVVGTYSATLWFTNQNDKVGQGRTFTLSVISPPSITQQPTNQAVVQGANAAFSVQATGGLPLAYQWQFNGTNLTDTGNISGSLTPNLTISTVSPANVGTYAVVVTNYAGTVTSSNATLTLLPSGPVIVLQPTNQTVPENITVQMAVGVIGSTPFSYQWSFNNTNIVNATNATLTLANVQLNQSGNYSVLITNIYGATNSATAVLTVNPPPPCDPVPSGIIAWWRAENNALDSIGGNNGTLMNGTGFTNGEVGTSFEFDGVDNYVLANPSVLANWNTGTNGFTFEGWIKPNTVTQQQLIAEYERVLGSGNGADVGIDVVIQSSAYLDVNLIDNTPGHASHDISTPGNSLVAGVWQHIGITYNEISGLAVLYINGTNAAQENFGSFTPQTSFTNLLLGARTYLGSPSSPNTVYSGAMDEISIYNRALSPNEIAAIYLAGSEGKCSTPTPPTITTQPTNQTVPAGSTAMFIVTASGSPVLTYQWSFSGTNIVNATNATLTLTDVQSTNSGNYSVFVANAYGSTNSATAVLTVSPPPPCDSLPSGIVAWWRAEDNALDSVGGNNGTLMNGTGFTNGEVGAAFDLNGGNDYVVANPASPGNLDVGQGSGLTFEGWINPATVTQQQLLAEYERVLGSGNGADVGIDIVIQSSAVLYADLIDNSGNSPSHEISTPANSLVAGVWQHIAVTYDKASGLATLYINGESAMQANFGSFTPQTSFTNLVLGARTYLGSASSPNTVYSGLLDELSLYNRALSSNEIAAIYLAGSEGKCFTPTPPAITSEPTNQTLPVGVTATFTVTASGSTPLAFQWSFDGTNIINATNATLTLPNVQLTNSGDYSVLVTNLYGSTNSTVAVLTVYGIPPFITAQPTNQTVAIGSVVAFGVIANGTMPLSYQWSLNGTNIANATNTTLTLTGVQLTNSGNYSVLVTNLFGSTNSAVAVLTVYGIPPHITSQPTNQTVITGSTATFGIIATGTLPLNYQWSFNGTNIANATNTTLTLTNVQLTNSGNYAVLVTNLFGSTNSAAAVLTVNPPPTCNPAPSGIVAWWAAESNALDSVGANNGTLVNGTSFTNGEVGTAFRFNGVNNYVLANPSVLANWNTGTNGLTFEGWIKPTTATKQQLLAEYERVLGSSSGADVGVDVVIQSAAYLDVNMIDNSPGHASHDIRSSANSLVAGVWQHIAMTYNETSGVAMLYLNGTIAAQANLGTFTPQTGFTNLVLGARTYLGSPSSPNTVYSGLMDEFSVYSRALSSNEIATIYLAGSAGKCPLAPTIFIQPTNQTANANANATFKVLAGGTPYLNYQWYFNGTNIVGATNATLTLASVQLTNTGNYSVLVANNYGATDSAIAALTVQAAPIITSQPTNQTVAAGGSASFGIIASGSAPLSYQWYFDTNSPVTGATNATLTLANVQLANGGYYSVRVTNLFGSVTSSNALLVVQAPPVILTQPTNVTAYVGGLAAFTTAATGSPLLSYQWNFNGQTNFITGATNAVLTISNVQLANAGVYALTVTNGFGSAVSSNVTLTVIDTLDHFTWSPVPSPRFVGAPFGVSVQARDSINQLFTNFTGVVFFTVTNGATVKPPTSGSFVQGVWNGPVMVAQTGTNLVLQANDGAGHAGLANAINVLAAPSLEMARSGDFLLIFWPTDPAGFVLESSPNLLQWTQVSTPPLPIGNQYLESIQIGATNQYYRLRFTLP